ncbi:conserved hypothetical protein [Pediculus humanus corporis]|uniref:Receptor-type tyrosine-protein phosphatase N2 n=1 Tax=Pediculus humanus subsp. corporis TaxID=121224 RepID=E0VZ35_PEDHC|nr:uncharacterized protein Phum_PHUM523760 [Pediculus humanus corporis]EEB18641.1 conserved hypothetical protein [Pediculus humanus corporis]
MQNLKIFFFVFSGCLFNSELCKPEDEWCFDDNAFGKCISYKDGTEGGEEGEGGEDFYEYQIGSDFLRLLKKELENLIKNGYRWSHVYTQCVIKSLLFSYRYQKNFDKTLCDSLPDYDPNLFYFDDGSQDIDPKSVGQVQFTPSVVDPHAEFADEIYLPVIGKDFWNDDTNGENGVRAKTRNGYMTDIQETLMLKNGNKNEKRGRQQQPDSFEIPSGYLNYINELPDDDNDNDNVYKHPYLYNIENEYDLRKEYDSKSNPYLKNLRYDDDDDDVDESNLENLSIFDRVLTNDRRKNLLKSFSRNYNTPEKFRKGHESKDEVFYPKLLSFINGDQSMEYYYPEDRQIVYDGYGGITDNNDFTKLDDDNNDGVYTEGGVVYIKDDGKNDDNNQRDSLEELMNTYGNWGFKRPERLDVKKPGPAYNTNNYAFKGGSPMESPSLRRLTTTVQPTIKEKDDFTQQQDEDYAYVILKNKVNTWQEGSRIVRKVEELLDLPQNTFTNIRVDQNSVKFKIDSNRLNLNASETIKKIDSMKDSIQRATGIEIVSTKVGNQNHSPTAVSLLGGDERQLWILSFLLCAVIAAVVIVGTAFFIIKRHPHGSKKIDNLSQMDSEASKDYQDLCRARMASKTAQDKSEGNIASHRVTSLAKESEGQNHSPSSRSSTSSWSEEPALTNMDISTGHMVLSYMEDHLKNKDRLEQEWVALCAYEAEPCATTIALQEDNIKKNRYGDVLPYDHARVVLNELFNASGSSYINASTITDHDPRNPAYIATQGPLPQTTTDFWQMVWEQGSVVMVMLTRLTENGTAMCHRYWPEEGSEIYHIYEVHLVSEHIWCDDYLVRSFYLKNIKTGETRTVTQFHFLSWPENGVPLSTKALLEFRRKVNKSYRGRSCPVVVHCSDGVGRTGTYCLIDMVLNRMAKGAKEIDIAATLEHIRDQRLLMVRTKQQFEFVLMAVAEEVHAILKALPANPNHSPPPIVKEKD